ncbi:MAG: ABC transporter permease [Acidobacteriota bacterium]
MKRVGALLVADVRLQLRYGLYTVSLLMVVIWSALLLSLGWPRLSPALLAPFIAMNLIITTFYFIAALVLFEESEGVLTALVVSPVAPQEYLFSKVASLTTLATVETLVVVAFAFRKGFQWPLLIAGTGLLAALYALVGFLVVVRLRSINSFLMPSMLFAFLLFASLLQTTTAPWNVLLQLHPAYPAVALLRHGAQGGAPSPAVAIAAGIWCCVAFGLAVRDFRRFIVERQ